MKIRWITLIAISLIMVGCAPKTQIQKIHIQMDHQNPGKVDIFNSFDEVGRSYKKVAELKVRLSALESLDFMRVSRFRLLMMFWL